MSTEKTQEQQDTNANPAGTEASTADASANSETPENSQQESGEAQAPSDTSETNKPEEKPVELTPEKKLAELQDKVARMQADFDNFRKRLAREKEDAIRYANEGLLEELLPIVDNFELGLQAADTATDAQTIAVGMKMVKTQLDRFLENSGVKAIDATGQAFDPNLHDAVEQQESTDVPEGHVLFQRRKGYQLADRLIRPATVIVAQAPKTNSEESSEG